MSQVPVGVDPVELTAITKAVCSILTNTNNPPQDEINVQTLFAKEISNVEKMTAEAELQKDPSFIKYNNALRDLKSRLEKLAQNIPTVKAAFLAEGILKDVMRISPEAEDQLGRKRADIYIEAKNFDDIPTIQEIVTILVEQSARNQANTCQKRIERVRQPMSSSEVKSNQEKIEKILLKHKNELNEGIAKSDDMIDELNALKKNHAAIQQNRSLHFNEMKDYDCRITAIKTLESTNNTLKKKIALIQDVLNVFSFTAYKQEYEEQYKELKKILPELQKKAGQRANASRIAAFLNDENTPLDQTQQLIKFKIRQVDGAHLSEDVFSDKELRVRAFLLQKSSLYHALKENISVPVKDKNAPVYIDSLSDPKFTMDEFYIYNGSEKKLQDEVDEIRNIYAQLERFNNALEPILNKKIDKLKQKGDTSGRLARLEELQQSISKEAIKSPLYCKDNFKAKLAEYESFYASLSEKQGFIGWIKNLYNCLFPSSYKQIQKTMAQHGKGFFQSTVVKEPEAPTPAQPKADPAPQPAGNSK